MKKPAIKGNGNPIIAKLIIQKVEGMEHFKTEIKPIKGTNKYECSCFYEENGEEYQALIYMVVHKGGGYQFLNSREEIHFMFGDFMPQRNLAELKLIADAQVYFYENLEGVTK